MLLFRRVMPACRGTDAGDLISTGAGDVAAWTPSPERAGDSLGAALSSYFNKLIPSPRSVGQPSALTFGPMRLISHEGGNKGRPAHLNPQEITDTIYADARD